MHLAVVGARFIFHRGTSPTWGACGKFSRGAAGISFVSRTYGNQCIHAQTIIPFVFQEHTVTCVRMRYNVRLARADGDQCTYAQTCPNHNSVRVRVLASAIWRASMPKPYFRCVPKAYGNHWCIHAQTILPSVCQEYTVTSASMLNHTNLRVLRSSCGPSKGASDSLRAERNTPSSQGHCSLRNFHAIL